MTDGPTKATPPEAPLLDEIILGEDDASVLSPVAPKMRASASPPRSGFDDGVAYVDELPRTERDEDRDGHHGERSSNRVTTAPDARKRAKMTLRIPDDEVARPNPPGNTPAGGVPSIARAPSSPSEDELIPLQPSKIISVGPEDTSVAQAWSPLDTALRSVHAPGIDPSQEDRWTPYQPMVVESEPRNVGAPDPSGVRAARGYVPPAPPSEDIPVDADLSGDDVVEDGMTVPRLPALDSEEIRLDDVERVTDAGEVPEVELEDLVIEAVRQQPPPPPKGTVLKTPTSSSPAPVTATALMSGGAPSAPALPGPDVLGSATPAAGIPVSAPSTGAAPPSGRSAPLVFVPTVAGIAPPPMSEAAANRKKTRPWWEELFNDDFIRTMAKVTDREIAREVDFIEESLGCEAGATILDLACGTGRHAVELATRGYQVVGFDLSLAMLARASDEAQDRKQKLNFVQGDMREMLFEDAFDGIFAWNTSFGFFDEEKNNAVIAKVHRALKKGGQFLLDVVNRDYIIRQAPSLAWFEGDGCICMDEMQIDFITSRMKVKRTLMMDDGRTKEIEYSIRVYALHELGKMLHDNGFRVAEVSGRTGTPGVFFGCESPRTLILAEKR